MDALAEILRLSISWRIDVAGLLGAMTACCLVCRRHVAQNGAGAEFPRSNCVSALLLAIAGALLAEWCNVLLGYPDSGALRSVVLARWSILGASALSGGVLLWTAVQLAFLRSKLRIHADTQRLLEEAKHAADEASRAKSDFLAVMSHEIRTPLNAVMGFAKLLRETRLEESQRGYLSTITSEGERLGSLINDLLDLTKIEGGQLTLERVPFAPAEIVAEVLRLFAARAGDRRIDLRFEGHLAGHLLLAGDPLRFRQIIVNLVDNAIKFTPAGSVTVHLSWSPPESEDPRGRLMARVRDTGIGIPADKQPRLFQ
ncbi:MAG: hypothetical protein HUU04_04915, partial [Verrucomicrobiae bacterium]|nr:hypothetical protein [Verrucomicrobiae bacterium]